MYPNKPKARIKMWGDDPQLLTEIANLIRSRYTPYASQSQLLLSKEGGFHLFVEIYEEAPPQR